LHDLRVEILDILRAEINPWVDAYPIPAGISLPKFVEKVSGFPGFPWIDRSIIFKMLLFFMATPKESSKRRLITILLLLFIWREVVISVISMANQKCLNLEMKLIF